MHATGVDSIHTLVGLHYGSIMCTRADSEVYLDAPGGLNFTPVTRGARPGEMFEADA